MFLRVHSWLNLRRQQRRVRHRRQSFLVGVEVTRLKLFRELIGASSRRLLLFTDGTHFFERRRRGIFVEPPA